MSVQKRITATVKAADPEVQADPARRVSGFEVDLFIDDRPRGTKGIGPDGGKIVFGTITIQDNAATAVRCRTWGIDAAGNRSQDPAVSTQTYQGSDTLKPETPEPAVIDFEDPEPGDEDLDAAATEAPPADATDPGAILP